MDPIHRATLFYDGDCGLCNRSVRFLIRRDRSGLLCFAPLQGTTARDLLPGELRESLSTLVYRRDAVTTYTRSEAVLRALIDTGSCWRLLARPALAIPRAWRDGIYNWVAKNRHRLFPKNECPLPTTAERERLLP